MLSGLKTLLVAKDVMTFDPIPNADSLAQPRSMKISEPTLLGIVRMQTEIATSNLDLAAILELVCQRTQAITGADGAVV